MLFSEKMRLKKLPHTLSASVDYCSFHALSIFLFHSSKLTYFFDTSFSLPNVSNQVRWSVDLRWQSPHHNYGFYNIQDGVLFRSPDQPSLEPDWEKFFSVDRKEVWRKQYAKAACVSNLFEYYRYVFFLCLKCSNKKREGTQ